MYRRSYKLKEYRGILELKNNELYLRNRDTKKLIKIPHYCKCSYYPGECGGVKGTLNYNSHLNEWTFISWQDIRHEVNIGNEFSIFK